MNRTRRLEHMPGVGPRWPSDRGRTRSEAPQPTVEDPRCGPWRRPGTISSGVIDDEREWNRPGTATLGSAACSSRTSACRPGSRASRSRLRDDCSRVNPRPARDAAGPAGPEGRVPGRGARGPRARACSPRWSPPDERQLERAQRAAVRPPCSRSRRIPAPSSSARAAASRAATRSSTFVRRRRAARLGCLG